MPSRRDAERIQRALLDLEADVQKRSRAPSGMVKCPLCGRAVEPTKNGRVRVHDESPWVPGRCPASGKAWKDLPEA